MVNVPFGSRTPAIHFLRAVTGLAGVKNQVQRAPLQQRVDCRACVQVAPALLGVAERDQHLTGDNAMARQGLGPGARQRDLADRRRGLAVFELERAAGELEHGAAECNGARRHDQDVAPLLMKFGKVAG